ncbi:MAG TPA: cytochrome c [Pirellulales bacterium]|nr:cytochrome c [Pirellulales bacterium]
MRLARHCRLCWLSVAAGLLLLAVPIMRAADSQPPVEAPAGKQGSQPPPHFDADVLELFATDARTKLGPGQPGGPIAKATVVPGAAPGEAPTEDNGGGSFTWSKLISSDNLEAEIKAQVPLAAEAVKTSTGFKGNGREKAQTSFTVLAALFGVIAQYDGDVRWKKDAPGLEKAFSQAGFNCKTSSDAAYKEAQKRATELGELVRGGTMELPKGDASLPWNDMLNRPAVMRRMEEARAGGKVAKWLSGKNDFKKNKDGLLREAQLLAMFSEIIKAKGFESGDDESYQKYAAALQKQCLAMLEAIKTDDQDKAQSAFAQVGKACDTCHGDFR